MQAKTLIKALPLMFKIDIVPLIVGRNGIGKTHIPRQYAKQNNLEYIEINLGELESQGDLLGLQTIVDGVSTFLKPSWWPKEGTKGLIVLDELNRASPHMLQGIFRLMYGKRLHTYTLPEGWNVLATANPNTDDYITTSFEDKAFLDRTCFIKFEPTQDEFLDYSRVNKMDSRLLLFLSENRKFIEYEAKDFDIPALPSRRTYSVFVDSLLKENPDMEVTREILIGLIGVEATIALTKYLENPFSMIRPEDIALNYKKVKKELKKMNAASVAYIGLIVDELTDYVKAGGKFEVENIKNFLYDIPKDLAFQFGKDTVFEPAFKDLHADDDLFNYFKTPEREAVLKKYGHG